MKKLSALILSLVLTVALTTGVLAQEGGDTTTEDNDVTVTKTVTISDNQVVFITCTQSQVSNQEAANIAVQTVVNGVDPEEVDEESELQSVEANLEQTIDQNNPQSQTNCTININHNSPTVSPTPSPSPTVSPTPTERVVERVIEKEVRVEVPSEAPTTGKGV